MQQKKKKKKKKEELDGICMLFYSSRIMSSAACSGSLHETKVTYRHVSVVYDNL